MIYMAIIYGYDIVLFDIDRIYWYDIYLYMVMVIVHPIIYEYFVTKTFTPNRWGENKWA